MLIVDKSISLAELKRLAESKFGNLVKAVVDVNRKVMAIDADLHADEEAELLANGSRQEDLWGINLYPEKFNTDDFVEFDSIINLRPSQKNMTRSVEDKALQKQIKQIVATLIVS